VNSLSTTLVLSHRPNIIAAAAIVIACEQLVVSIPSPKTAGAESSREGGMDTDAEEGEEQEEEPYWLELFDIKVEEVQGESRLALLDQGRS
jgi:hypothetical protein